MYNKPQNSEFNIATMNAYARIPAPAFGVRIVCLPKGYDNFEKVKELIEETMLLGMVKHIHIQHNKNNNNNNRVYMSAYVDFVAFHSMSSTIISLRSLPYGKSLKLPTGYCDFFWPNGQGRMTHLSVQKIENINKPLELPKGAWTSLHIPVLTNTMMLDGVPFILTDHLQDFIETKIAIGKVKRIDFVERDDMYVDTTGTICHRNTEEQVAGPELEPGEVPETEDTQIPVMAAFIHMECWFKNRNVQKLRHDLDTYGQSHVRGYSGLDTHQFQCINGDNQFFIFKINHRPIPEIDDVKLNIHQLASMNTKLKEELFDRDTEIERLKYIHAGWWGRVYNKKINPRPIPDTDVNLNIHQLASMNTRLKEELSDRDAKIKNLKDTVEECWGSNDNYDDDYYDYYRDKNYNYYDDDKEDEDKEKMLRCSEKLIDMLDRDEDRDKDRKRH